VHLNPKPELFWFSLPFSHFSPGFLAVDSGYAINLGVFTDENQAECRIPTDEFNCNILLW
jgi:hypothetical protein